MTGGLPAAAGPSPQARGGRSSRGGFIWLSLVIGILLLLTAAFADQEPDQTIGTLIAGVALVSITAGVITGLLPLVAAALISFFGGLLLTIAAFSTPDFGVVEAMLLIAGAATFISAFAALAASRRVAGDDEDGPQSGVETV